MCIIKIKIPDNSIMSLNSELKICLFGAYDPLYDTVCSINRELLSSHIINVIMIPYRSLWKCEEFCICIAAASIALLHTTILFSVHCEPSQIHYSLNTDNNIF
jgi:hypothetical protein